MTYGIGELVTNRAAPSREEELWTGRTHFKILFKPALIQAFLITLHVLVAVYIPSKTSWAWWDAWGQFSLQALLTLASIFYVIAPILRWRNSTFRLTNKRVVKNWGVLYKHSLEIPLNRVTSVSVERGIIDRIFGCGTLNFQDASAMNHPTQGAWNRGKDNRNLHGVRFYDVPNVLAVKELIDETRYNALDEYS